MRQVIVLIIATAILLVSLAALAGAQKRMPHYFYGAVLINGSPAPAGTVIEARGEGVSPAARNPISVRISGEYGAGGPFGSNLTVTGNNIAEGAVLSFYINNIATGQTFRWQSGSVTRLNLIMTVLTPVTAAQLQDFYSARPGPCPESSKTKYLGDRLFSNPRIENGIGCTLSGKEATDYQLKPCHTTGFSAPADCAGCVPNQLPCVEATGQHKACPASSLPDTGNKTEEGQPFRKGNCCETDQTTTSNNIRPDAHACWGNESGLCGTCAASFLLWKSYD